MNRDVEWSETAERDLRRLDHQGRERIRRAVYRFAETDHGDVQRLEGRDREWGLRVGDWRVLFTLLEAPETADSLLILRVLPRGRAYRD
jgi:mRNA-degrading endonuclease RelE of RelBE toxin-antitoxin system